MSDNRVLNWLKGKIGVPDLVKLFFEVVTWRKLLFNRITLTLLIIAVVISGGSWYVSANSTGVIEGEVVTEDGQPVTDVSVTLRTASFGAVSNTVATTTDDSGQFRIDETLIEEKNSDVNLGDLMEFRIIIERNGEELTQERYHHLFPGQQRNLKVVVSGDG